MSTLCKPTLVDLDAEVFHLLPLGICVFDQDLRVLFWNRTLEDWTDVSASEIVDHNFSERYPELDSLRFRSRLQQVLDTNSPVILSPAIHKYLIPAYVEGGGDRMMVQRTTLRPLNQEGTQVMAVIEDVTVTHRQLGQLRKSNEELEQFAYVASHDLQEPLRKISAYCQLLKEEQGDKLDDEGRDYLRVVMSGAERLRRLVQDLLLFSRVTTHGKPLAPTDAQVCLEVAIENLEIAIKESNTQITHDPLPIALADESQLTQLLQNLLSNAIKYRGDQSPVIHVGLHESDRSFEISVSDNGIGIAQKSHDRIFKVFQRLHNRRKYEGTGIGLAVCKRIVERFGGAIHVESEPGEGSTFSFSLWKKEQQR